MEYEHAAPCGLFCGACPALMANKQDLVSEFAMRCGLSECDVICHGCRSDTNAVFCKDCQFKACIRSMGVDYCFECQEFPCQKLIDFKNDPEPHHSLVIQNLVAMRVVGVEGWVEEQTQRWSCPNCKAPFSWYEHQCGNCKAPLRDSRMEADALAARESDRNLKNDLITGSS